MSSNFSNSSNKNIARNSTGETKRKITQQLIIACVALICCFIISCALNGESGNDNANVRASLSGAGSTFANPIYTKMIDEYRAKNGTETTYQAVGSSAGIKMLMNRTVDFGASDAFLSDDEMNMFPSSVVQLPTCLGAVVISYNLPGNPELKLSPEILSGIFLGTITKWNDNKIKAENPGIKLLDQDITVVHRADGSGTSYIFTDYLSKVSDEWKTKIGVSKTPKWPVGASGNGNEGVAGIIKLTPGAIGYVELAYALQKYMGFALIRNASGKYIKATLESTTLAANVDMPADARVSITNSNVKDAYPISSFTWILLYKEQDYNNRTMIRAASLLKEIWWMVHDEGQQYTKPLNYAPLPPKAILAAEKVLSSITYDTAPVLQ
jgi:phosphate transport system substrate-binding protein